MDTASNTAICGALSAMNLVLNTVNNSNLHGSTNVYPTNHL